jgi:bacterioferritin
MNKPALIEKLNRAIYLELCAAIQYGHYASVLMGADRRIWHELFEDMSKGGLKDARFFGFRVAALGGTPTIEHAPVKQATDITTMLTNALEHEKALVDAYNEALEVAKDNAAYRNLLEEQIWHEHEEVEELQVYLNKVQKAEVTTPVSRRAGKTG